MMDLFGLLFHVALGVGIGAMGMWLYMMSKYAGRPVAWRAMALSAALTFAFLGMVVGFG